MAPRVVVPDPKTTPTVSVEQAGRLVGIGRRAAYEAARRGDLPVLRFGRSVRVPTAALLALLGQGQEADAS